MCGIVGSFGCEKSANWVKQSVQSMRSRGPDAQIVQEVSSSCCFGSARLAMTDATHQGHQPFFYKGNWVIFNGELYNFKEIIKDLFPRDRFVSSSDTEVLIKLLHDYPNSLHSTINGPYALGYFNSEEDSLRLERDISGKKPLYYQIKGSTLYFCSRPDLLETSCKVVESEALIQILNLGYLVDPLTMYKDIKALKPGEQLNAITQKLPDGSKNISINSKKQSSNFNSVKQESLRALIINSVERRIEDQRQISLSLSGGMDSTIIALVLKILGKSAKAYSVHWPDSDKERYNHDFQLARKIAEYSELNFQGVAAPNANEVPKYLDKYLEIMGEPNCNPSGLSMIPLFEKMHVDGSRLALTGDGSDEIFAGYSRYRTIANTPNLSWLLNNPNSFMFRSNPFVRKFLASQVIDYESWSYWHETFSYKDLITDFNFTTVEIQKTYSNLNKFSQDLIENVEKPVDRMMRLDSELWLKMESNRRLDRVAMHFSIEPRCPFQDRSLVNFAESIGKRVSVRSRIGKKALIEAFPELKEVSLQKRKVGFISPLGHWIRNNMNFFSEELFLLADFGILNEAGLQKHIRKLDEETPSFQDLRKLWNLVVLGRWLRLTQSK